MGLLSYSLGAALVLGKGLWLVLGCAVCGGLGARSPACGSRACSLLIPSSLVLSPFPVVPALPPLAIACLWDTPH